MKKKVQRILVVILMMILAVCSFGGCFEDKDNVAYRHDGVGKFANGNFLRYNHAVKFARAEF